ncbi:unnamed protein product [Rotaria socialis]|uniref:Uncharacterized protein n=1 Tax=Rotaria socialis TaxID=392032 RepID=A0A818S260_9BILA|nr:unnamed protein product [Rotaria socialis]CAF3745643.1 unnamed protein product [Rotaria socialis]
MKSTTNSPSVWLKICVVFGLCFYGLIGICIITAGAISCVQTHQIKQFHTNTTCLVEDYSFQQKTCKSYYGHRSERSTCYDKQSQVIYSIFNGSSITSSIKLYEQRSQSDHQKGTSSLCWYDKNSVTSVIWTLPTNVDGILCFTVGSIYIIFGIYTLTSIVYSYRKRLAKSRVNPINNRLLESEQITLPFNQG